MTITTTLNGFIRRDHVTEGPLLLHLNAPTGGFLPWDAAPPVTIRDARPLQIDPDDAFFARHGFVLLDHPSKTRDWDNTGADGDIARTYLPEVETLIRDRLLPGYRLEIEQSPNLLRRGPGTPNPFYAKGVHADYGLTADDYMESLEAFSFPEYAQAWRRRFDRPQVAGFMVINFWRTVYMAEPLQSLPLAVCDPLTVAAADVVPSALVGFAPSGKPTNQLSLRHDSAQAWYYYPAMTGAEALAFKVFQTFKDGREPGLRTCFHTAFADPWAPADAPPRQSCEHRVGVFILEGN